jgi:hypothetical protein
MKWEVKTSRKTYRIETTSSKDAVDQVAKIDNSEVVSVKLIPKSLGGKAKRLFKNIFNKQGK